MKIRMCSPERRATLLEQRAVIKFCVTIGMMPRQTNECMEIASGTKNVSRSLVHKRQKRFREGREELQDDKRCGRPTETCCDANVMRVESAVTEDRWRTIREMSDMLCLSYGSVQKILTVDLAMRRLCARWMLTAIQKKTPR